ncbi:MAG: transposase [Flavobacteriaceae bacterium]|nr:transposase [Flavobacteriaceae bacterium]
MLKEVLLWELFLYIILIKETNDISRGLSSKTTGISLRTQERWIERYISVGIEGLLTDKPNLKRSKIITDQIHQGLSERVNYSENSFLGYWDAKQWVLSEYGVEIAYHWIRAYLIKHFKTKLKSPRKSHYKKEPEAEEAYLKEFSAHKPEEYKIIVIDNAGFDSTKNIDIPDNIYLLSIPPYTPELNPCEQVWQYIKNRYKNKRFKRYGRT